MHVLGEDIYKIARPFEMEKYKLVFVLRSPLKSKVEFVSQYVYLLQYYLEEKTCGEHVAALLHTAVRSLW